MTIGHMTYIEDWLRTEPDWWNNYAPTGDLAHTVHVAGVGDVQDWWPAFHRWQVTLADQRTDQSAFTVLTRPQSPVLGIGKGQSTYYMSKTLHLISGQVVGLRGRNYSILQFVSGAGDGIRCHSGGNSGGPGTSSYLSVRFDARLSALEDHGGGFKRIQDLRITGSKESGARGLVVQHTTEVVNCIIEKWGWHACHIRGSAAGGGWVTYGPIVNGGDTVAVKSSDWGDLVVGRTYHIGPLLNRTIVAKPTGTSIQFSPASDQDINTPVNSAGVFIFPTYYYDGGSSNANHSRFTQCVFQTCGDVPGTGTDWVTVANPTGLRPWGCAVRVQGGDANGIVFDQCRFDQCAGWAVSDDGFLGNSYWHPHSAFCGTGANALGSLGSPGPIGTDRYAVASHPSATGDEQQQFGKDLTDEWGGDGTTEWLLGFNFLNANAKHTVVNHYFENNPYNLGTGAVVWWAGIGGVYGKNLTLYRSPVEGNRGQHVWRVQNQEGAYSTFAIGNDQNASIVQTLTPSDDLNLGQLRTKYAPHPNNDPNEPYNGSYKDAGFFLQDYSNTSSGLRTLSTYSKSLDRRFYKRSVPTKTAVVNGSGICTVTVDRHPFGTGDWVYSSGLRHLGVTYNAGSSSAPVQVTAYTSTTISFPLAGAPLSTTLDDGVGTINAYSAIQPGMPALPEIHYTGGRELVPVWVSLLSDQPSMANGWDRAKWRQGAHNQLLDPIPGGTRGYVSVPDTAGANMWLPSGRVAPLRRGFYDRAHTQQPSIAAAPSRVVTLARAGGVSSYAINSDQKSLLISGTRTNTFSDTEGTHFLYLDGSGAAQELTAFSDDLFTRWTWYAEVYWDATNKYAVILSDERHGQGLEGTDHQYRHRTQGTLLNRRDPNSVFGLTLSAAADNTGSSDTHAQIAVAAGSVYDEDILLQTSDTTQVLSAPAQIPILYREGTNWRTKKADTYPLIQSGALGPKSDGTTQVIFAGANGRCAYNQISGGSGSLVQLGNDDFFLVHIFAGNDTRHRVMGVLGQNAHPTLPDARAAAETELQSILLTGLPTLEWVWLYTLIFQTANAYGNTPKARIRSTDTGADAVDWRIERPRIT